MCNIRVTLNLLNVHFLIRTIEKNNPNQKNNQDMAKFINMKFPGSGRSPGEGKGYPLQYSCLENSMDRGSSQSRVHRVKSRNQSGEIGTFIRLSLPIYISPIIYIIFKNISYFLCRNHIYSYLICPYIFLILLYIEQILNYFSIFCC